MKNIAIAVLSFVVLITAPCVLAQTQTMTAQEIMQKYTDHADVADETEKATMTLVSKQGKTLSHALTIMIKEYPGDLKKILIRFTAPETISGAGLLIVENADRSDDQWLYLPTLKKIKKISTTERSHSFMGSEFSYEDLYGEKLKDFSYELIGSERCGDQDCYIIEAKPASSRKIAETGYGKRKLWIRKDIFFKVKAEYFDKENRLLKTELDEKVESIGNGKYRMNTITMTNNRTENKTLLESVSRTINSGVSDTKFTTRFLEQDA